MKVNTIAVIRQLIGENRVKIEVKHGYIKKRLLWDALYHMFLANGWKYSKLRKEYYKTYYDNEYTEERFHEDIALVKDAFKYYKHITYKNVSVESNV